jgi:hypothetical protein
VEVAVIGMDPRSKVTGLYILPEDLLPCGSFVRNGKSFLKGSLFPLLVVPVKTLG